MEQGSNMGFGFKEVQVIRKHQNCGGNWTTESHLMLKLQHGVLGSCWFLLGRLRKWLALKCDSEDDGKDVDISFL